MGQDQVRIFDTTLRDGEQAPGFSLRPSEKLVLARQLDALGVDIIEAGFPIASPADAEAVRTIATEIRRPVIACLARCHKADLERAAWALEPAEQGRIHTFIATSDLHLQAKLRMTREQCLEAAVESVRFARRHTSDVEFSAEDATRSDFDFLCRVIEAVIDAGATTVNLPDTVGYTTPDEIRDFFTRIQTRVPNAGDIVFSTHCHDDLGLAAANSLASVLGGARQVECTINGIGERAGNASLEEFVMALQVRADALPYDTGIHTQALMPTSSALSAVVGVSVPPNKAIVGANAFAHEAGIHQDGMLKHQLTYEIMRPETVGAPGTRLVLGKHSGMRGLDARCRALGHRLRQPELERLYTKVTALADRTKTVDDDQLADIIREEMAAPLALKAPATSRHGATLPQ